jgi:long-chain acyl-CoA synthetase
MNVARWLIRNARIRGEAPALALGTEVLLTQRQLAQRAAVLAAALRGRLGLTPGDRVALFMKNQPHYLEVLYAAWHAGLVAVPINAKLHPRECAWIIENSGARACFCSSDVESAIASRAIDGLDALITTGSAEYRALLNGEPASLYDSGRPDDLAWLFYTSGTTGRPKGAMLSHRNLVAMSMNYFVDVDAVAARDTMIHSAPLSHGSGLYGLPHLAAGANQVIPESGGFDPDETLKLVARWPGASFFFAPTMIKRLVRTPALGTADVRNLKTIVYGGAPMYLADAQEALRALGPKLVQIYGQGEAPMTITALARRDHVDAGQPRYLEHLASVGVARTDVEVRTVNGDGHEARPDEIGEVVCRGDVVMTGYWNNPDATRTALRDGWLYTGDMGSFDDSGYLTLKDRSKDMIISGGSNIYPREIEEVLLAHPQVAEASVVGRSDPEWGETVVAFVVVRPGERLAAADLDALCLQRIARFKRPRGYRFVDALPKNNYGKVLKTELRQQLETEAGKQA